MVELYGTSEINLVFLLRSSTDGTVWMVVYVLNEDFLVDSDITDFTKRKMLEDGFENKSRQHVLHSEVGAMDRCFIWQKRRVIGG